MLDPPCSALGLRPKLVVVQESLEEMYKLVKYQRMFVREAVQLLKPGGIITYSTCTIHSLENEGMVKYIIDKYPNMQLLPISDALGSPGLPGCGLSEEERMHVRRFDPIDEADTIGFFVAKFKKSA